MKELLDLPKKVPPTVHSIEPLAGPWSQSNNWGTNRKFAYPKIIQPISVISNDNLPGPPSMRTVVLSRQDEVNGSNNDVYAHITFGVGGSIQTVLVDWANGNAIQVPAGSIRVAAIPYQTTPGIPYVAAGSFVVGCAMARDSIGESKATFTQVVTVGANVAIPVPKFAKRVVIHQNTVAMSFVWVRYIGGPSYLVTTVGAGNDSVPIPGWAAFLVWVGGTGGDVSIQWELAI